jgi:hypothetical protein
VNDFWETSNGQCTGYRYYFDYYTYDSTTNYSNPLALVFSSDKTVIAHFTKIYHPGDADGDGDADQADYTYFMSSYPSTRGDSTHNYLSTCDFNSDGAVDNDDLSYLEGILGVYHYITVNAYNQYGYPSYSIPVYIDVGWVGFTGSSFPVLAGTHTIAVPSYIDDYTYGPHFQYPGWAYHVLSYYYYDGNYDYDNPISLSVTEDKTIDAYYYSEWL